MLFSTSFDDIEIGATGSYSKSLTERDIALYGEVSGDINPVHFDSEYAAGTPFKKRIAHGMWSAGLISTCIGTILPGPGSVYLGQQLQFRCPVHIGDRVTAKLTVKEKQSTRKWIILDCRVTNQNEELIAIGDATVMPPTASVSIEAPRVPTIKVSGHD
ncbi:MAG: 3-hydroxybutyryl-CoA dehydratase [Gammaproteobacteria bacterium]|nr:3-hydroxybutyryl-CoA dehydratase [Gammaproteobacteria bacterium]